MYPEIWTHQVKALPYAEAVIDWIGEKIFDLRYFNSDDVVTLVSQWLKDFYSEKGLTPPHPVYPFDERKLKELGKEKPIVRRVLKWCAENFILPIDSTPISAATTEPEPTRKTKQPVESAHENELAALESTVENYMDDKATLADALRLGFSKLIGQTVEQVQIEEIAGIKAKGADKNYLDFKIVGKENGTVVKIGVAVLQESGGRTIQATLKRLIDYKKFDLTRGCLVRSKDISSNAAVARAHLNQLLSPELGGEWALLKSEDIKPLLAIMRVQKARENYELSEEQINDFIVQKQIAIDNYLIHEILSDPSGQIPDDVIDEDSD